MNEDVVYWVIENLNADVKFSLEIFRELKRIYLLYMFPNERNGRGEGGQGRRFIRWVTVNGKAGLECKLFG